MRKQIKLDYWSRYSLGFPKYPYHSIGQLKWRHQLITADVDGPLCDVIIWNIQKFHSLVPNYNSHCRSVNNIELKLANSVNWKFKFYEIARTHNKICLKKNYKNILFCKSFICRLDMTQVFWDTQTIIFWF